METGSDSPPFHGFGSDTSADEPYEDPSSQPDNEVEERGEKSKNTPAPPEPPVVSRVLRPTTRKRGQIREPASVGSLLRQTNAALTKLRPRINTVGPSSSELALIAARNRAAGKKVDFTKKSGPATPSADPPASTESLEWDNSGQRLQGVTSSSRLWSSSTQFSVSLAASPNTSPNTMSDEENVQPLSSAASSTANTIVEQSNQVPGIRPLGHPPTEAAGPSSSQPVPPPPAASSNPSRPDPGQQHRTGATNDPPPTQQDRAGSNRSEPNYWHALAMSAILRAQTHILPYRGKRVRQSTLAELRAKSEPILDDLLTATQHCHNLVRPQILDCITQVTQTLADLEDRTCLAADESQQSSLSGSPSAHSSPIRQSAPPTALAFAERAVKDSLQLIADDVLRDVEPGSAIDDELLKQLHEVTIRDTKGAIKECRDATGRYASLHGAEQTLITQAQTQCKRALEWTQQVVTRFRSSQLHLEGNTPGKEALFKPFDPIGKTSVYEFFMLYEDWARGYLSDSAKARLLYSKFLSPKLTEGYEELKLRKHDYLSMKNWLIDNFGSIKAVADLQLKAIRSLKAPRSDSDHLAQSLYLRSIHRHLTTLLNLEIRKGVPVPQMREFISSYTFIAQIVETLPHVVQDDWTEYLAEKEIIAHKVEGMLFLDKILSLLKKRYLRYEYKASIPVSDPPPKPKSKTHHATDQADSDSASPSSPPRSPSNKKANAADSSSKKQGQATKKDGKKGAQDSNSKPAAQPNPNLPRWTCPIKDHENHSIKECNDFFEATPRRRRFLCRWTSCWCCFSRNGKCLQGGCSKVKEVPTILLCQDCATNAAPGTRPTNILMCGLQDHAKPDLKDIHTALEKWISGFDPSKLSVPITVIFATTHVTKCGNPPKSRSSPPSSSGPTLAYDTCTGNVKEITKRDSIIRQSKEDSFYIMQQLCIAGESVLAFFDSGSNTHIIEGELAEKAGFTVLDDRCTRIGVVGGGDIWSEYGSYSCLLGPDVDSHYHEVECQGLARITSSFPEFDLMPIAKEAARVIPRGWDLQYPISLGGDRVKLLIGVRSTSLAPVLQYSLPGGLGIYHSVLLDVHGSTVCYGGPHEAFTRGYAKAGMSANHLQVLFTEAASSYMRAPYTFVAARCDSHGPIHSQPVTLLSDDTYPESYEEWCDDRDSIPPMRTIPIECNCNELTHSLTSGQCYKAAVPLSKLKGLMDEDDIPAVIDFRCDVCANCPKCRVSARAKTRSHQEEYEQEVIEKSVTINFEEKKVFVDLPFIKPPVEFLTTKHNKDDNMRQALRIYQSQCKKSDVIKEQVRASHKDLVGRGFMAPLSSLSSKLRRLILDAPFRHYFPWRAVHKPGSISTPVRLVVDPSCTGLNIILAKGRNMLPMIPDILVRLRTQRFAWSSDISKLYNRLHLNDSSLPYSLFLYNESLSDKVKPDIWIQTRAWYGVSSTGNQAGVALERLAEANKDMYPLAVDPMTRDKFVDDMVSGADTPEEREEQVRQTTASLETAGFSMKYVARSGLPPPAEASNDGNTVGCLGLAWDTERDTLRPALESMNLMKKVRGQKAAPDRDLSNPTGIRRALTDGLISRAGVLSRVAEFFDPNGWWEPLRLQAKLSLQDLNPLDWSDKVPDDLHEVWVNHFMSLEHARRYTIPRCIIPADAPPNWKLRLICLADAAEGAGGTAIYAGTRLPDGHYTCDLLMAKSRLMSHTVPRNELEAILLMADTALTVRNSLGNRVESVFFYTDSTVAMAWVLNTRKRLRMFVYNRSQSARQAMRQVIDGAETIPLYHIDGTLNVADMVTKPRSITPGDLATGSPWMNGLPWMRLPTEDLPTQQYELPPEPDQERQMIIETFQDVEAHFGQVESRQQLLDEIHAVDTSTCAVFSARAKGGGEIQDWLSENFKFVHLGWNRAKNRLKLVCRALFKICHRRHDPTAFRVPGCPVCNETLEPDITRITSDVISRYASRQARKAPGGRKLLKDCTFKDGIWYATQRLNKEGLLDTADLDFQAFYDGVTIKKVLPVILVQSPLFHSLALHTHFVELPHAGVETTLARIRQTFFPLGDARRALSRIKKACSKCRLILKQTVGLELADIHNARTTIAPPFYSCMMDIAMGFKARPTKDSRKSIVVHAIVIVCLLTSATSIHVIEGLTTQSVVMALERHSSRYGVPAQIFVDSGTQLEKLRDTSFSLRDIRSWESEGMRFSITVSTPKAHEQQGRVEAKIKIVRKMLQTFSDTCELVNTLIGWETLFARIADHIDNVPISKGSASAPTDLGWEVITPNRLKMGRNNFRQLEGNIILSGAPQTMLERNRQLSEKWYEIFIQRIQHLVPQSKKVPTPEIQNGDVVLFTFQDAGTPRMWTWKLGVIVRQKSRSTFEIRYVNSAGTQPRLISRDLRHICLIHAADEIPPMSTRFVNNT